MFQQVHQFSPTPNLVLLSEIGPSRRDEKFCQIRRLFVFCPEAAQVLDRHARLQPLSTAQPSTFLELQHRSFLGVLSNMASPIDPNAAGESPTSIRIVVTDDFEPWRRAVLAMLKGQTDLHVVGEAEDGWEALRKAQTLKPDLILLDIGLPNLNGIEAAKRIRKAVPGAKIIFLTQDTDNDIAGAAMSTGARGYVLKADAGSELLPAIKAVRRGNQFVSSGMKMGQP